MGCGCNGGSNLMQTGGGQVGGGTKRRKHSHRHRKNGTRKTRGHGRKRCCRCPGGCKRSTCPCCTGKRFCCTKKCRGRGCKC